ncbi:MAG TPA: MopE-related protein [Flavobacteriales bacterium]|nr:MopE-related protein [Flavobacteriales bacterium]
MSPASTYAGEGEEHGTLVAGVVGATGNNGVGVTGVNWDVDLVPLGFGGTMAGAISGFEGALSLREDFTNSAGADGALVVAVTVSWGFSNMSCGFGYAIFEDMGNAGILAITAGPNEPVDIDVIPDFPSGCPNSNNIAVTCIGPDGENPFAVGNSTLHLQAPGIAIPTTAVGGAYDVQDGNSFAVPHVAGAVALLYSAPCPAFAQLVMTDPPAAAQLVKSVILQGGVPVPGGNAITITGRQLNVLGAYQLLMAQCVQSCTDLTITYIPTAGTVAEAVLSGPQGNAMATASGPVLQGCWDAGCYQAAFSATGGAPIGGTWIVTDGDAGVVASGSSADGQFTFSFGDIVSGCTTPNSGNFNPAANCNDGSCCPGDIVRVKVLAEDLVSEGTAQVEIVVGGSVVFDGAVSIEFGFDPELGDDLAVGTVQVCVPDGCMSIAVTDGTIPLQEEAYVTVGDDDPITFLLSQGHLGPVGDAPTPEVCDGLDNDCDGLVDEDFHWFVDADGDGFGSTTSLGIQCTQPPNAVADSSDCDDADPARHATVTLVVYSADFESPGTAHYTLELGGATVEGDMALLAEESGMGQATLCIGDGCYSITITPNDVPLSSESYLVHDFGTVEEVVIPFDTETGHQSEGPLETCDGIDNDCDGEVDEDFLWYTDADGDGFGDPTMGQVSCTPVPGAVQVGSDCDDSDPALHHSIIINTGSASGESGLAHYVVTQGGMVVEGDIPLDEAQSGSGIAEVCIGSGCVSIEIQTVDVPLTVVSHAQLSPGSGFTSFFTTTGLFGSVGEPVNETCNGIDDDCDGEVDEDFIWYADNDLDSWGDASTAQVFCAPPVGNFSQQSGDCDDSDPDINPGAPDPCQGADGIDNNCNGQTDELGAGFWLFDGDDDGYGVEGSGVLSCVQPPNTVLLTGDCDDTDPTIHPDAVELCDGIDNDCNGQVDEDFFWYADLDNDGFGDVATEQFSCEPIPGMINTPGDCNDNDPNLTVFNAPCDDGDPNTTNDVVTVSCTCQGSTSGFCPPGEIEDCNGNCAPIDWIGDGTCDDGSFEWEGNFIFFNCPEFDNDGGDCGSGGCVPELCDGLDNDCDGAVDEDFILYVDADGDGFGVDGTESVICTPGPGLAFQGGDCDDTDENIFPGNGCSSCDLTEQAWAADNQQLLLEVYGQCVGECGFGDPGCVSACMQSNGVPIGAICVTCLDTYYACVIDNCLGPCNEGPEACALCQNQFGCRQPFVSCMGQTDADGDGWWAGSDCDDNDPAVHPTAAEVCDGVDNDCDGVVDEDFIWYADSDGDGWGENGAGAVSCTDPGPGFVQQTGDCDDDDPLIHPGAQELCDGVDNNCDGITDGIDVDFQSGCTDPMACNYDPNAICPDGSCAQGSTTNGDEVYSPNWTALDSEGNTVELYALLAQGRTVILDLFAAWCAPSIQMLQSDFLQDWNAHMGPNGTDHIRMVQVAIDQSAGSLTPFIAAAEWPVIINDVEAFATMYGALGLYDNAVPTLLMICPDRSVTMLYPLSDALPYTGQFNYDPIAATALLNARCGCRSACTTSIGCMDINACDYDPNATCPGPCASAQEWFADNDGDGVGSSSLGTACTQPPNSAAVSGDCDDADPSVQSGFTLFAYTLDENDSGTAHYVITHPGGSLEGDIIMPAEAFGVGSVDLCLPGGCMSITITPNDVPLWPESYLIFNSDEENFMVFATEDGYFQAGVAELCDGLDNDCDGEVDEEFVCDPPDPCTDYILELQSDGGDAAGVTYEVLDETGTSTVLSGNNPIPAGSIGTLTLCLPDGCYQLRVTDGAGDGLLGYVLREVGANGRRLIDNTGNMSDGVSAIANGGSFCVPLGDDRPIHSSCDKLDWVNNKFIVCHANAAVSAQYGVTNTTSGYEFWFFDPNGSYSYRRFRSHATSDGTGSGATRACHFKVNGWFANVANPHLPANILLNVRVRGRVAGTNLAFGPACQFKIDPVLAACPRVKLQDDPANTSDYSCGVSRDFGGASNPNNRIYANPPQPIPVVASSAVRYQFRFRITGENICIVRPPQQSARMVLNWTTGTPLECSKTYEVDVRVSLDGGATWCFGPAGSSEAAACADNEAWGKLCLVTINPCAEVSGGTNALAGDNSTTAGDYGQHERSVALHPNPNRGDQLFLSVTKVDEGVNTVSVDILDLTGQHVMARTIAVTDGFVNTNLELRRDLGAGLYLVSITAGDKTYTERLVIQP